LTPSELPGADPCVISLEWGIELRLATKLVAGAEAFEIFTAGQTSRVPRIISGFRMAEKQLRLEAAGRPAAPVELSTHTTCPATGADLSIGFLPPKLLKFELGHQMTLQGLRWGGGSAVVNELPEDWNHFDLGPRLDPVAQAFRATLV